MPKTSAPASPDALASRAELMRLMQDISGASPIDMIKLRLIMEPEAAAAAAMNARAIDVAQISEAHASACAAQDMPLFEHWDGEFHKRIFESTRNDFLKTLHDILLAIRQRPQWIDIKRRTFSADRRQLYCTEHQAILTAIEAHNPAAASEAMRKHIQSVQATMFSQ